MCRWSLLADRPPVHMSRKHKLTLSTAGIVDSYGQQKHTVWSSWALYKTMIKWSKAYWSQFFANFDKFVEATSCSDAWDIKNNDTEQLQTLVSVSPVHGHGVLLLISYVSTRLHVYYNTKYTYHTTWNELEVEVGLVTPCCLEVVVILAGNYHLI